MQISYKKIKQQEDDHQRATAATAPFKKKANGQGPGFLRRRNVKKLIFVLFHIYTLTYILLSFLPRPKKLKNLLKKNF